MSDDAKKKVAAGDALRSHAPAGGPRPETGPADDYLWDRSGAPDPEIEALENLMSGLRARPGSFRLPDAAMNAPRAPAPLSSALPLKPPGPVDTSARLDAPARRFASPALYAAAALLLITLGALLWPLTRAPESVVSIARVPTLTPAGDDATASLEEQLAGEQARAQVMTALNIASGRLKFARDAINSVK